MKTIRYIVPILILAAAGCKQVPREVILPRQECIGNLSRMNAAAIKWCSKNKKTLDDTPTMDDLRKYLGKMPTCPSGGIYVSESVRLGPRCTFPGHVLPIAEAH